MTDCGCCCHGQPILRRLLLNIRVPEWCLPFLDIFNPLPLLEHIKDSASSDDVPVLSAHAILDCLDTSREYWVLLQQALTDLERVPGLANNVQAPQRQKKRADKRTKWEQRDLSLSELQMSGRNSLLLSCSLTLVPDCATTLRSPAYSPREALRR